MMKVAQTQHELWLICGREPVMFRIPYFVVWDDNKGKLVEAVILRPNERAAAGSILGLHGQFKDRHWWVSRDKLERIASKTPGGDPESYLTWGQPRPEDKRPNPEKLERNEFIESLYQAGVGKSVEELTYYWHEFCQHAAHWMINKEKPVDMYFIRLHNCPYRANWKTLLTQRFHKLGPIMHRKSGPALDYVLHKSGFMEELLSLDLLAFCRQKGTVYRTVEVEHRQTWWKLVRKAEATRLLRKGPYNYAEYFSDSIKRWIPGALKVYLSWLAQIARPCVDAVEGGRDGRVRLVPNNLAGELRLTHRQHRSIPPVVPNRLPRYKVARRDIFVFAPDGSLPQMPAVQPETQDVRDNAVEGQKPVVDQPRNGEA